MHLLNPKPLKHPVTHVFLIQGTKTSQKDSVTWTHTHTHGRTQTQTQAVTSQLVLCGAKQTLTLQDLCSCASQSYSIQPSHQTDTGAHSNHWLESWITTTIFAAFRCNLLFTVPFAHMAALALRDQFVCLLFLFFLFFSNCTVEMWNSKMEKWNTGKE